MINIPIYRAKKIDSDEWIEGYLTQSTAFNEDSFFILKEHNAVANEIDPSTLSIHFPNMLDKNNNKIFASLSKDGKGGDMFKDDNQIYTIVFCEDLSIKVKPQNSDIAYDGLFEYSQIKNNKYVYDINISDIQK